LAATALEMINGDWKSAGVLTGSWQKNYLKTTTKIQTALNKSCIAFLGSS